MALHEQPQPLPGPLIRSASSGDILSSKPDKGEGTSRYPIEIMQLKDVPGIVAREKVWAPWLRKSRADFEYIAGHFGDTQRVAHPSGSPEEIAGYVTVVKTHWEGPGSGDNFKTWDEVAGGSVKNSSFEHTYKQEGNAYVLMAVTVDPDIRGEGLAPRLVTSVVDMARRDPGIQYVFSAFRPSDYGKYQLEHGPTDFAEYCAMTDERGKPIDTWLRSVNKLGMVPIRTIEDSMIVEATKAEFEGYQRDYHPKQWTPITEDRKTLLCGETGTWYVEGNPNNPDPEAVYARYIEKNLLGVVYSRQPL